MAVFAIALLTTAPACFEASASPSPAAGNAAKLVHPVASPAPKVEAKTSSQAVLDYLGQVIQWYQDVETQERLIQEPAETLFVAENRQIARSVLSLAFEYARAEAALIKANRQGDAAPAQNANSKQPAAPENSGLPTLGGLIATRDQAMAEMNKLKTSISTLRRQLARARNTNARDQINQQLASSQGELELAQSRVASLNAIVEFENDTAGLAQPSGLLGQIEELQHTVVQPTAGEGRVQAQTLATRMPNKVQGPGILS
ncbi:MAG: hypothetical protein ACRD4Q_09935, partial [Candidatus Acidiferrales bacterium]